MGCADAGLTQEHFSLGEPGLDGRPRAGSALLLRHATAVDDLVDQGLGSNHGVGQTGERRGVLGPRTARESAPFQQRRGVVDDDQKTAPGVVEEQLRRGADGGGAQRVASL